MPALDPTKEQFDAFRSHEREGVIHMLNFLKFRERANYQEAVPEGTDCSGLEAYQRYGRVAIKKVVEVGGRVLWSGHPEVMFIGEDEDWDQILLVEYPSRTAFLKMLAMPEYQAATKHREAGLEATRLIQNRPEG